MSEAAQGHMSGAGVNLPLDTAHKPCENFR
jgi:hypothetical protein